MANIYLGNTQLGGGGIVPTNTLPTANAENYDKHELYLNDGELKYLDKYYSDNFTQINSYATSPLQSEYNVYQFTSVDKYIYYIQVSTIRRFDIEAKTFTTMTSLPQNYGYFDNGSGLVDGDYIYFRNGYSGYYKYNYKTNEIIIFRKISSPGINFNCGHTIYNGYLYTFGGRNGTNGNIGYIYKYNLSSDVLYERQRVGTLVITNAYGNYTFTSGNIVYIFVWQTGSNTYGNKIWKFDLTTETLTETSLVVPKDLNYYQLGELGGNLYIIGGQNFPNYPTYKNVIKFNPKTETFTILDTQLQYQRDHSGWGWYENHIYLMLGWNAGSATRGISELTFPEVIEYKTLASSDVGGN